MPFGDWRRAWDGATQDGATMDGAGQERCMKAKSVRVERN